MLFNQDQETTSIIARNRLRPIDIMQDLTCNFLSCGTFKFNHPLSLAVDWNRQESLCVLSLLDYMCCLSDLLLLARHLR